MNMNMSGPSITGSLLADPSRPASTASSSSTSSSGISVGNSHNHNHVGGSGGGSSGLALALGNFSPPPPDSEVAVAHSSLASLSAAVDADAEAAAAAAAAAAASGAEARQAALVDDVLAQDGELVLPPSVISAHQRRSASRQFSAPTGESLLLGAEPYDLRTPHGQGQGQEQSSSPLRSRSAAPDDLGQGAGAFDPTAYPASMPTQNGPSSVLVGLGDSNDDAFLVGAGAGARTSSPPIVRSGNGSMLTARPPAGSLAGVTSFGSSANGGGGGRLANGSINASSSAGQRVPRVTNLPLKAQRRPESRKANKTPAPDSSLDKKKLKLDGGAVSSSSGPGAGGSAASSSSSSSSSGAGGGGGGGAGTGAVGGHTGSLTKAPVSFSSIYVSRHDVQAQLRHLICVEHYRPMLPADMPDELAALLSRAWHPLPNLRPAASDFVETILNLTHALKEQAHAYMRQHNQAFRDADINGIRQERKEQ